MRSFDIGSRATLCSSKYEGIGGRDFFRRHRQLVPELPRYVLERCKLGAGERRIIVGVEAPEYGQVGRELPAAAQWPQVMLQRLRQLRAALRRFDLDVAVEEAKENRQLLCGAVDQEDAA